MRSSTNALRVFHAALWITAVATAPAPAAPRMVLFEEATNYG
jgi:hypothetical protein